MITALSIRTSVAGIRLTHELSGGIRGLASELSGVSRGLASELTIGVVCLVVAAALVLAVRPVGGRAARLRLSHVGRSPKPGSARRGPDRRRLIAGLCGLATMIVSGSWWGFPAGLLTAVVLDQGFRRIEPPSARQRRAREMADLPLAADLLAAALRAGAPADRSVSAVAEALGGPLAERLDRVARTMRLGGTPEEAWSHLDGVAGSERLVMAAVRSAASGGALAGALHRLADDLRADRATAAEAAARRAGVLIVLPLGLCFLPAFILAGLVPVIVAVLGDVL